MRRTSLVTPVMLLWILGVLAVASFLPISGARMSTLNPGFEGAKCYFYGVYPLASLSSLSSFNNWEGKETLHRYQDAEAWIARNSRSATGLYWDTISWANLATPNDAAIDWEMGQNVVTNRRKFPTLKVHVESNIALQDVNRQGDPLGWNSTDPMSGRRIEYWSKTPVKTETENKVTYSYTLTKESFLVVPAEFWVGFYLVPAQTLTGGTGSGWREGDWQNLMCWFMLDFTTWDNAYRDAWLDDPEINVFDSEYGGSIVNKQQTANYRGGFPIAAWVQGWEKAGYSSDGPEEDPVWYDVKYSKTNLQDAYTLTQLAQLKQQLMARAEFSPELKGSFLSLHNEPSVTFDYEAHLIQGSENFDDPSNYVGYVKTPDTRMQKVMYFPITIQNLGVTATGDWYNGYTLYYPSVYFRIRILYGVYGDFTYLWSEELKKDETINYPNETERHGTTVITTPPSSLSGLLSSPTFWLIVAAVIIVGLVIITFVFGLPLLALLTLGLSGTHRCLSSRGYCRPVQSMDKRCLQL